MTCAAAYSGSIVIGAADKTIQYFEFPRSGSTVVGVEPGIQLRLSDSWVAGMGVLFTVAGQNTADAIYPNFAIQWYWNQGKKVIMR